MSEGPQRVPTDRRGTPHTTYDVRSTAIATGPIDVQIVYEERDFADESSLRLFHNEAGGQLSQDWLVWKRWLSVIRN